MYVFWVEDTYYAVSTWVRKSNSGKVLWISFVLGKVIISLGLKSEKKKFSLRSALCWINKTQGCQTQMDHKAEVPFVSQQVWLVYSDIGQSCQTDLGSSGTPVGEVLSPARWLSGIKDTSLSTFKCQCGQSESGTCSSSRSSLKTIWNWTEKTCNERYTSIRMASKYEKV